MTPEEALALAKAVSDIYATATADLLATIARATANGLGRPDWAEKQLAQVLPLRREAQRIVARMQAASASQVHALIHEVYTAQAPLSGGIGVNNRTVVALATDMISRTNALAPRVLRSTEDIYRQVVAETLATAAAGGQSRQQAAAAALDRFAKAGIGGFTDAAGRTWSLETYAEMATRSALGRAHLAGTLDQYEADGREYVIVSNSPEECPVCRDFEGTILSLGADVPPPDLGAFRYGGSLASAISRGLFHPNCTHRINPFVPGLSRPMSDTANPEGYELRQRQRAHERGVRESKRRVAALRPVGDSPILRTQERLLASRQRQLDEFVRDLGRKGYVSKRRTQIPGGMPPKPPTGLTPRTPVGAPVSGALTVSGPKSFKGTIQDALEAIDEVHGDGALPIIDLLASDKTSLLGWYTPGSPRIQIGRTGDWVALTAVHEIGHFLDHKGFGNPQTMTTQGVMPGPLQAVFDAIAESEKVDRLKAYDVTRHAPSVQQSVTGHINYLLSAPELWARAYAQWVAQRSGKPVLEADLVRALETGKASGLVRQWDADDFAAIAAKVDDLMRDLGWTV